MAAVASAINLSPLARALVLQGQLVEADARHVQGEATKSHLSFVEQLIQSKRFSARDLSHFAAQTFGFPQLDLAAVDLEALPTDLVERKFLVNHRVLPLGKRGNRLFLATSDPANQQGLDEIKFATGLTVEPVVVDDDKLGDAALIAAMHAHPILIERPVVQSRKGTRLCRPPERVQEIL